MLPVSELAATLAGSLNRYQLQVAGGGSLLDVESFSATEALSQTFCYRIVFTGSHSLSPASMLLKDATFSLTAPGFTLADIAMPASEQRTVHGVVTQFSRLSASRDEARYELTLEPRLALLANASRPAIYQNQSVPEIVEHILRSQHQFEGWQFEFRLRNEYPRREQVMQWQESDLAFIERLLSEVGIWYRFEMSERLKKEVVVFADDQQFYQFDVSLPLGSPSGMNDNGVESVWNLSSLHQVVSQSVRVKDYNYRQAGGNLKTETDVTRGAEGTYGQVYQYADNFQMLGKEDQPDAEAGTFYARLHHERLLNGQHQLGGESNASGLLPGQMLEISGAVPETFAKGVVITAITASARRDSSFALLFTGIPYSEVVGFRPPLMPRPTIAGTLPARVTSITQGDSYAHLDKMGRYRVKFDFDLDSWKTGYESLWVRLAKPYSGDSYGMHLPLIDSTEVAVAFEQGNPDRPYIAYALHDSRNRDHVTQENNKRNVIRTPANNKLRMEDERGREHIKLSTEYGGKSQLNLGHLVDGRRQQRGEGFELRTDQWGTVRAGKGLFLTADAQPKAGGGQLDMQSALGQLENSLALVRALAQSAATSGAEQPDIAGQNALQAALSKLQQAGLVASAPAGVAVATPKNIQLAAGQSLTATAGNNLDLSVFKRFTLAAGEAISLFAQKLGLKIFAAQGPVSIQAQTNSMTLQSDKAMSINSINGEIRLDAASGITLVSQGAYIKLQGGAIEIGAPGAISLKSGTINWGGSASLDSALQPMTVADPAYQNPMNGRFQIVDHITQLPKCFVPYRIETDDGSSIKGVSDENGYTEAHYGMDKQNIKLFFE
ncbi:type VI secretion system Vgr family protein [Biostraticola tofi]|uniref:Type VI secretion system secreted protein VgrG n=1 Tax=Biostraticola tofi TaxID=466109 RepID=A0A4R3Z516_9GAMM|nr:type VI secretion system tip protein VgrG [Biostraticola tofi]TCW00159.1 type VI secretion system secreted protein VgrG [Biostraticola tofi]